MRANPMRVKPLRANPLRAKPLRASPLRAKPLRAGWIAICLVGLVTGLVAEYLAFGWDRPLRWLPDLAVGLTMIGAGAHAAPRSRGAAVLLAAAGFAWFAGTLVPAAVFWHRGPLIHLLTTYPGARPASGTGWVVVGMGYVSVLTASLWRDDVAGVALAVACFGLAVASHRRASGRRRHDRRIALEVVAAFAGAIVVGALVRLLTSAAVSAMTTLLAYEVLLVAAALRLVTGLRPPAVTQVADLVVELGEGRSEVMRNAFARALRDPTVRFGYWEPASSSFVSGSGQAVESPVPGDGRVMTTIERDGQPVAALIHDAGVLADPSLARAVAATTRLTTVHAELRSDVRHQVEELAASARRVQIAADEERSRLERQLASGPEASLRDVLRTLDELHPGEGGHLERAVVLLDRTVIELADIARGLHPRELASGLGPALSDLVTHSPATVQLAVGVDRLPPEIETAIYYVCAEALTNVAKHAQASEISIEVSAAGGLVIVTVTDNGDGGADVGVGSGLAGLADRVDALGGRFTVWSAAGSGTRLTAKIPHGGG